MANRSPPHKRTRIGSSSLPDQNDDDWFETAWSHFHDFMNDDEARNWSALEVLIQVAEPHINARASNVLTVSQLTSRERLLPAMVSVSACLLAQNGLATSSAAADIEAHLKRAVTLFDKNAAAWALGGEYLWAQKNHHASVVIGWCEKAVALATLVKQEVNTALETNESLGVAARVLLELLLMNQVVGVELNDDDDDDDGDDDDDSKEEILDEDLWTPSAVESKARFLAALMHSSIGQHDQALSHLQHFVPNLTHRLSPCVWGGYEDIDLENLGDGERTAWDPTVFGRSNGVLPSSLKEQLCEEFGKDSAYWKETPNELSNPFSFFVNLPMNAPSNLVEHTVCHHLLPLVQEKLASNEVIAGFDWRIRQHLNTTGSRLDFHKVLLAAEETVAIPVVSSVLFLRGSGSAIAVVLDQTPDEGEDLAKVGAWRCTAAENTFLVHAGNLLHGILPVSHNASNRKKKAGHPHPQDLTNLVSHKDSCLTLHVGFWTRNASSARVYAPCGLYPTESSWVQSISQEYAESRSTILPRTDATGTRASWVPAPAWQLIPPPEKLRRPPLEVPKGFLERRCFLNCEPGCFQEFLFDQDGDSEESDEEEEN